MIPLAFSVETIQVVLERWGSLDILAAYGASRRAAAPRAHLHAIRNRKQGPDDEKQNVADNQRERKSERNSERVIAMTLIWIS